jgi:hypothetical protein
MGDRIAHGLVSLVIAERWTVEGTESQNPRRARFERRSPRGQGVFTLETIAMPSDLPPFTVERLRSMAERSWRGYGFGEKATAFDESAWTVGGVACVSRSLSFQHSVPPDFHKMLEDLPELLRDLDEMKGKWTAGGPRIRRDWWVARGTDMANVWYESPADDAVAAALVDCEAVVRSIRFGPPA